MIFIRLLCLITMAVQVGAVAISEGAQRNPSLPLMVFAAADLGAPFARIVPQFEKQTGIDVTLVLGSTGMLAQQIRNGAPADVFFAANESFVNALTAEHLTNRPTSSLYARGRVAAVTLK